MENQLERLYAIDLLGILVHKYQDGQLEGEIIHQYKEESTPFFGVLDLIKKMELQYDEWDYPKPPPETGAFGKERSILTPIVRERNVFRMRRELWRSSPLFRKEGRRAPSLFIPNIGKMPPGREIFFVWRRKPASPLRVYFECFKSWTGR